MSAITNEKIKAKIKFENKEQECIYNILNNSGSEKIISINDICQKIPIPINKINENIEDTKFKVKESKDKIKEYLAKRKNEKSENEIVEIEPLQLIENTEVAEENTEA